ncbi:MAG TPA: glycosyltransferase family 9 protein [Candidatus Kapabacteria bacterium]|nr:glycosyltransferase family 9 protein [Candidatus Kapabacteria bacterium]
MQNKTALRILLIRLGSLGDLVLVMPLIKAIREKYPDSVIDLIVKKEFAALTTLFPGITNVIPFDVEQERLSDVRKKLESSRYTHVLDLHSNLRSRALRKIRGARKYVVNKRTFKRWVLVKLKINLLKSEPDVIGRYFETVKALDIVDTGEAPSFDISPVNADSKIVAICPGAKHKNKQWLPEYFSSVAKDLTNRGYMIEFFGSESEKPIAEEIASSLPPDSYRNRCGIIPLEEVPQELSRVSIAITNDSGLMHLASASGIKIISMFGPTVREFGFYPRSKSATVLENTELNCRPCTTIGLDYCPRVHFKCMKDVNPLQVISKIELTL